MGQLLSKKSVTDEKKPPSQEDETKPIDADFILYFLKECYSDNWKETVLDGPEYIVESKIGEGTFGKVFKCRHRQTSDVVAIKEVKGKNNDKRGVWIANVVEELAAMHRCSQTPICKIFFVQDYGWQITDSAFYIIMKYYPNGSLQEWMEKRGRGFYGKDAFFHSVWLIRGIEYLHGKNIIHRDLKPRNILVDNCQDGSEFLKIADFGLAKIFDKHSGQSPDEAAYHSPSVGTADFMAPEVCDGHSYSKLADIYSLGKIIAYLHIGPELNDKEIKADNCGYPVFLSSKYSKNDCHTTVVGRMMCEKKDQRLTLELLEKADINKQNCCFNFGVPQYCPAPCNKKLTSADGTLELF